MSSAILRLVGERNTLSVAAAPARSPASVLNANALSAATVSAGTPALRLSALATAGGRIRAGAEPPPPLHPANRGKAAQSPAASTGRQCRARIMVILPQCKIKLTVRYPPADLLPSIDPTRPALRSDIGAVWPEG